MKKVMFLCTGNACRSQMAEGFSRELGKGLIEASSAGLIPTGVVHPRAITVMAEAVIKPLVEVPVLIGLVNVAL